MSLLVGRRPRPHRARIRAHARRHIAERSQSATHKMVRLNSGTGPGGDRDQRSGAPVPSCYFNEALLGQSARKPPPSLCGAREAAPL
jgi:hypothetical protein